MADSKRDLEMERHRAFGTLGMGAEYQQQGEGVVGREWEEQAKVAVISPTAADLRRFRKGELNVLICTNALEDKFFKTGMRLHGFMWLL